MITVKPVFGQELSAFFAKERLEFNEFSGCTVARDGEEILGYCTYYIYEKGMTVLSLKPENDLALADGILRSALHIAACRSAMDARYGEGANEELFKKLGFIKNADDKTLNIDLLFGGCKGCAE